MEFEYKPRQSARLTNSKPFFTETIYMKQKRKISEILTEYKNNEKNIKKIESLEKNFGSKLTMFNDVNSEEDNNWDYATFDVHSVYNEETPVKMTDWGDSFMKPLIKGVEIRSLIFRTKENFQIDNFNTEISTSFSLKGESALWIILRSDADFNEYSAIIKISKEDKSQNMHVSMGTFVHDINGNLIFKIFSKQQLIDYSKIRNKSYKENDICELKAYIYENAEEKITAKFYVNDSKTENMVSSEFFLPFFDKKSRIMIAGSGQQCCVRSFISKSLYKHKNDNHENAAVFSNDKRNCDCCLIC